MKMEKKFSSRVELRDLDHGKPQFSLEIFGFGALYLTCVILGIVAWFSI